MSRVRSPNYPAIGLLTAVEKARAIHKNEGKNSVSREALAKDIGFGTLNGGSSLILSALSKYGLLENTKEGEARLSNLAIQILFGEQEEKEKALAEAGSRPTVFKLMQEKWPDSPPGDASIKAYLMKESFSEQATTQIIQFYREIIDIAKAGKASQSPPVTPAEEERPMPAEVAQSVSDIPPVAKPFPTTSPGAPFAISFDGTLVTGTLSLRSTRDIDRLVKVLQAQKVALAAMQEDDSVEPLPAEAWN